MSFEPEKVVITTSDGKSTSVDLPDGLFRLPALPTSTDPFVILRTMDDEKVAIRISSISALLPGPSDDDFDRRPHTIIVLSGGKEVAVAGDLRTVGPALGLNSIHRLRLRGEQTDGIVAARRKGRP